MTRLSYLDSHPLPLHHQPFNLSEYRQQHKLKKCNRYGSSYLEMPQKMFSYNLKHIVLILIVFIRFSLKHMILN